MSIIMGENRGYGTQVKGPTVSRRWSSGVRHLKKLFPGPLKREVTRIFQNLRESLAYRLARKRFTDGDIHHIVFVCKGNICRSVFAEYYLKSITLGQSLRIESCGLEVGKSTASPREAVMVSREFGLDLSGHNSKGRAACDLDNADLIVPMEYWQYLRLTDLYPEYKKRIRLLEDFAPWPDRTFCNIYDPYGLGEKEFRRCFRKMQRALEGMKDHLLKIGQ